MSLCAHKAAPSCSAYCQRYIVHQLMDVCAMWTSTHVSHSQRNMVRYVSWAWGVVYGYAGSFILNGTSLLCLEQHDNGIAIRDVIFPVLCIKYDEYTYSFCDFVIIFHACKCAYSFTKTRHSKGIFIVRQNTRGDNFPYSSLWRKYNQLTVCHHHRRQ